MITIRRSAERGHADHGWLDTYYTFSFADYHDPDFMGFSDLRVINQDRVAPGAGFGTHPHRDMEIVTYVYEGALEHRDSMGNGSRIVPGEVQLMSAGAGVTHSEHNAGDGVLELLQMWVLPARRGTAPRYEQRAFPLDERRGRLCLVVDPNGADGALTIGQDARLWVGLFAAGERATLAVSPERCAWIHVARGEARVNGERLGPGDGAAIRGERELAIEGPEVAGGAGGAELVLWELPEA